MRTQSITIREFPVPMTYTAENSLLGALIADSYQIADVKKIIRTETFGDEKNADIWRLLVDMDSKGEEICMETVYPKVNTAHFQSNILPYIMPSSPLDVMQKASYLQELSMKRDMYFAATEVLQGVCSETGAMEVAGKIRQFVDDLGEKVVDDGVKHISEVAMELGDILQKREVDRKSGIALRVPTSFSQLDFVTYGGFAKGNLVILAARPSVGKTAIMLQMARAAAVSNIPALVLSLEMTNIELAQRMACATGLVDSLDLATGRINWQMFEVATGKFTEAPMWLYDKAFTLDDIINKITTAHKQGKCDIAFIDYLGLISYKDNRQSLYQQVTDCTRRMKKLAKEMNIPIVLLSQLNRDMSREGREPELHDLRDSGSIEQDADIVLMLARDLNSHDELGNPTTDVAMYVRKNRQGRVGDCYYLKGMNNYTTFYEVDKDGNPYGNNIK